jgi:hypothetical protein
MEEVNMLQRARRNLTSQLAVLAFVAAANDAPASPVTDFQARLVQTTWCLAQVEALVRVQSLSAVPVTVPEAIVSWTALVFEDVTGLVQSSAGGTTDEQKKVIATGLKIAAATLQDLSSLARNRGLDATVLTLDALGSSCRMALARL